MATKKKKSLKERLKAKKEELKRKSQGGKILRQKDEGTMRVRILPVGDENDFAVETTEFFLNRDLGGCISPQTFDEPCALMEAYQELKNSDDDDDKDIAKTIVPRNKYLVPVLVYKDLKGKKINDEDSGKLLAVGRKLYQSMIDLYLDDDEWGDMTDAKKGYDLKITRTGTGKNDTSYDIQPCKNTPIKDKKWAKPVDLEAMVREETSTYEETAELVEKFLNISAEDEDDKPKNKSNKSKKGKKEKPAKGKKSKTKKLKKRKKDI